MSVRTVVKRRRRALALPVVVAMVTVAFIGVAAASYFRSGLLRQLDGLVEGVRLLDLAEAAISEVATRANLERAYGPGAGLETLKEAFSTGSYIAGVLEPNGGEASLAPARLRELHAGDERLEIGDVQVRPTEYIPSRNRGRLRFRVRVRAEGALRTHTREVAQDFEFSLLDAGGRPAFLLGSSPAARIYP